MKNLKKIKELKGFILDMAGTTYLSNKPFPGVIKFLEMLKKQNKKFVFLTNNNSMDTSQYISKLRKMGIKVKKENIYTSGQATALYLTNKKKSPRVFVLGTPSFEKELEKAGCILTDREVDYVVVGFDKTLTYEKLKKACLLIRKGAKFIASHPDINCPTIEGYIPDCGSICAAITTSTGKKPFIIGKPKKEIILGAVKQMGTKLSESCIIGDRLYTDIKAGKNAGITTILVLSGETKKKDIEKTKIKPDFVFKSIRKLYEKLL